MPDIVTDIELPPLSLENLQHINWLTTIMLHTNTTTLRNKLISSFRTLMSFNLSHSLRHTCTLSPVTGGGRHWEWQQMRFPDVSLVGTWLPTADLPHSSSSPWLPPRTLRPQQIRFFFICLSLCIHELSHSSLSLTVFSPSVDFSVGLCHFDSVRGPCEAHWASARYEKNNAKNNLNKSLLSEFSWNKIQLIIWSCFISSCRKNMLAFYISANHRHVCLYHWYSFLISYKTCQITLTSNVRELTSMSWWRGCGGVTLSNSTPASVNSPDIFNQTSSSCLYRQNQVSPNMPKPIGVCA